MRRWEQSRREGRVGNISSFNPVLSVMTTDVMDFEAGRFGLVKGSIDE